jgi:uracil-DNA glycosylase family 4
MHRAGLANQPTSVDARDGLRLTGAYVSAVVRCAPPDNKPTPVERDECVPYLARELRLLERVRVIVCLGSFAWDGTLRALRAGGLETPRPKPMFGHMAEASAGVYALLGSYHPSQQNTFTGKLTVEMLDAVFARANELSTG